MNNTDQLWKVCEKGYLFSIKGMQKGCLFCPHPRAQVESAGEY